MPGGHPTWPRWRWPWSSPGSTGSTAPAGCCGRLEAGLGGVALFARNIVDSRPAGAHSPRQSTRRTRPRSWRWTRRRGDVTRLEYRTGSSWPGNLALGAVDDSDADHAVAPRSGRPWPTAGVDLDYAPDADVNVEAEQPGDRRAQLRLRPGPGRAAHGRLGGRDSSPPGCSACAKHFPGHGDTRVDSHLGLPEVDLGDDPTTSPALDPFRAAVAAGTAAVMSGHLRVVGLDPRLRRRWCPRVMTGLLRDHLGFTGLAVSDGLEMGAVADTVGLAAARSGRRRRRGRALHRRRARGRGHPRPGRGRPRRGGPRRPTHRGAPGRGGGPGHGGVGTAELVAGQATRAPSGAHRDSMPPRAAWRSRRSLAPGQGPRRRSSSWLAEEHRRRGRDRLRPGHRGPSPLAGRAPVLRLGPDTAADLRGRRGGGRPQAPLWLSVRDPHRFAWMADVVTALVAPSDPTSSSSTPAGPGGRPADDVVHVVTRGGSWAGGEAVVQRLARA